MFVSNESEYQNAKLNSSFELGNISVLSWSVGKLRRNEKNHDFENFCSKFEIVVCLQGTWGKSEEDFADLLLNYQFLYVYAHLMSTFQVEWQYR